MSWLRCKNQLSSDSWSSAATLFNCNLELGEGELDLPTMAGDLLKELPSFNKQNFSKFKADSAVKCSHQKPIVYLSTKDTPDQAVIVTDKANILLRYLHQQWENKHQHRKRDPAKADLSSSSEYKPSSKIPRKVGPSDDTAPS